MSGNQVSGNQMSGNQMSGNQMSGNQMSRNQMSSSSDQESSVQESNVPGIKCPRSQVSGIRCPGIKCSGIKYEPLLRAFIEKPAGGQSIATAQCVLNVINDRIFVFADNCRNGAASYGLFVRERGAPHVGSPFQWFL